MQLQTRSFTDTIYNSMVKRTKICLTNLGQALGRVVYDFYDTDSTDLGIICVHGTTSNRSMFHELAHDLCATNNLVVPDMIGRGDSSNAPLHCYNFNQYINDCLSIINTAGFKHVIWIGHSMGGLIGIILASIENSPVISLILDDVAHKVDYNLLVNNIEEPQTSATSIEQLAKHIKGQCDGTQFLLQDYMEFVVRNFKLVNNTFAPLYDPMIRTYMDGNNGIIDLSEPWKKIKCPILLLKSSSSKIVTGKTMKELQQCPHVSVHMIESNLRIKYTDCERKVIAKWIQNLKRESGLKSRFGIGSGFCEIAMDLV